MRYARIYPWRRTRRSRAPSNGPEAFFVAQFSAGCTPNMFGFDLRQGQGTVVSFDALVEQLRHFLAVIAGREMPLISVGDAMSTLAVVQAGHQAARTGGRISPSNRGAG